MTASVRAHRPLRLRAGALGVALLLLVGSLLVLPGEPAHGASGARGASPTTGPIAAVRGGGPIRGSVGPSVHPEGLVEASTGLNSTVANASGGAADVALAVGPNDTLELVEGAAGIFPAGGGAPNTTTLGDFFGVPNDRVSFPAAAFDPAERRFVALAEDRSAGLLRLGASSDSNASSHWTFWNLSLGGGRLLGPPSLGAGASALGIAATVANATTGAFWGGEAWVANLSELPANGGPVPPSVLFRAAPSIARSGLVAAGSVAGPSLAEFASAVYGAPGSGVTVWNYSGPIPGGSLVAAPTVALPLSAPVPVVQYGTSNRLRAPPPNVSSAVYAADEVTAAMTVNESGRDAVEVVVVNASTGALVRDQTIASGGNLYAPAVVRDGAGDLTVVAGSAGPAQFPSVVVTGEPYNEATFAPLQPVAVGGYPATLGCVGGLCPWGNVSAVSIDPADPAQSWVAAQFVDASGANWTTAIGLARYPALAAPSIAPDVPAVDLGQWVNFSAFVSGGLAPYRYNWTGGLPAGCTGGDNATVECRPGSVGNFTVEVQVTDAAGTSVAAPALPFRVWPTLALTGPTPSRPELDTNQTVGLSANASGGRPPYLFHWEYAANNSCAASAAGPAAHLACVPKGAGRTGVVLTVSDQNLASVTNATAILVFAAVELGPIQASASKLVLGQELNLSVTLFGGSGGAVFTWSGLPAGCFPDDSPHLSCVPQATGNYSIEVNVTDSAGTTAGAATSVLVLAPVSTGSAPAPFPWALLAVALATLVAVVVALALAVRHRKPPEESPVIIYSPGRPVDPDEAVTPPEPIEGEEVPALPPGDAPGAGP